MQTLHSLLKYEINGNPITDVIPKSWVIGLLFILHYNEASDIAMATFIKLPILKKSK